MDIEVSTPFFSLGIEESIYYEEYEPLQYNEHSKYKHKLIVDNYTSSYPIKSVKDLEKLKAKIDILIKYLESEYGE